MTTIAEHYGLSSRILTLNSSDAPNRFVAGAELEIECLTDIHTSALEENNIAVVSDGSLRANGKEFLLPPLYKENLVDAFKKVHACIQTASIGEGPFSQRTSIHVHMNCLDWPFERVKALLFLYSIFEPLAFAYVGKKRQNNIHCVPLWNTTIANKYGRSLPELQGSWHKYTAFNLIPLGKYGTVEFRHLYGTNNSTIFDTWLSFIQTLQEAARAIELFNERLLLDLTFLREIQAQLLTPAFIQNAQESIDFSLEENLIDIKLALL